VVHTERSAKQVPNLPMLRYGQFE